MTAENETVLDGEVGDSGKFVMSDIVHRLKRKALLYRPYWTSQIDIPGGNTIRMIGQMPNSDGDLVGSIRAEVYVPSNVVLPVRITIDWKIDIAGFWYRSILYLDNVKFELDSGHVEDVIRDTVKAIESTSHGSVRMKSMNLGVHKKVKNNKSKDLAFKNGMRIF